MEEEAEEVIKEGIESAEKGILTAENEIEMANREIEVAGSFGELAHAVAVAGAEVIGVLVNGILGPEGQKSRG